MSSISSEEVLDNIISSSEDEDMFVATSTHRQRPRRRPSFQAFKLPNYANLHFIESLSTLLTVEARCRKIKVRNSKSEGNACEGSSESDEMFSSQSAAGLSSRDMSPVELVRDYITDCTGEMVEDMERIYAKMSTVADRGAQMVHRTARGGADIVAGAATRSGEIAKSAGRMAKTASEVPIEVMKKVKHWNTLSFTKLPGWMKDNEFLQFGHRPELNSFRECFKSIFGIHSETGNIWTHLIGFVAFVTVAIVFYMKPLCDQCHTDLELREKLIFLFFFIGAILCLGLSSLFHTVCCHSEHISNLFCKLDYVGISLLTVGSFVPWIYYGFYCQFVPKVVYLSIMSILGICAIVVTMMDRFSSTAYRPARALLFVCLGSFGLFPFCHFLIISGWDTALVEASIHHVLIGGGLYILGAVLYGSRIPERFLPGKCDIWFQSHQIFHVLVIAAAFVHFHGMQNMAVHRLTKAGACDDPDASNSSSIVT
eukprot:GFUD01035825.1.p1 GENE.GFUD01035825.1~~GFUD01035825.1.p1  ORF type:complete len:483 (-),score=114.21 GFUD01035825.1:40-1488(-)